MADPGASESGVGDLDVSIAAGAPAEPGANTGGAVPEGAVPKWAADEDTAADSRSGRDARTAMGAESGTETVGPVGVLRALRRWRERDEAMRRETRREMGMGETDMAALRFLIAAAGRDEPVTGKRLADHLGISSASTTKLTDRLEASGHLRRLPHPVDGRAILLEASTQTHREVRSTLSGRHERMLAAAESLNPAERAAVVRFLDQIGESIGPDAPAIAGTDRRNSRWK
ncbi:DNA-binding MarR family transcriptional regulator [Mycetocola sp. BIGb0189]|uniref:MarR family winged helix-turn-helix transcriptional regulator n=1 Tax=Mycetocola sp. BIGb0189 TaxID=2940604 RepID=UPI002167F16D|nr:MarR family winged helix-turn-helix transcriptional regulator [Mycetocola sp. BIGb0189]MCS4276895.1 DNA-binding MarR family transcriptional regulator [Mycetocola sp. BIGb0189]